MLPSGAERHLSVIKYTGWDVQTRMPHSSQSLSACFQETRQRLYSPGSVHFYNRMTVQPMEIVKGCSPKWPALEPHSAELLFMRIAAYPAPTSALGLHVTGTENRVRFSLSSNTLRLNFFKKINTVLAATTILWKTYVSIYNSASLRCTICYEKSPS